MRSTMDDGDLWKELEGLEDEEVGRDLETAATFGTTTRLLELRLLERIALAIENGLGWPPRHLPGREPPAPARRFRAFGFVELPRAKDEREWTPPRIVDAPPYVDVDSVVAVEGDRPESFFPNVTPLAILVLKTGARVNTRLTIDEALKRLRGGE